MTTCTRCPGGGFIATKHGSKRCPECNPAPRGVRPAVDWGYIALGAGVYAALIAIAIVVGM